MPYFTVTQKNQLFASAPSTIRSFILLFTYVSMSSSLVSMNYEQNAFSLYILIFYIFDCGAALRKLYELLLLLICSYKCLLEFCRFAHLIYTKWYIEYNNELFQQLHDILHTGFIEKSAFKWYLGIIPWWMAF